MHLVCNYQLNETMEALHNLPRKYIILYIRHNILKGSANYCKHDCVEMFGRFVGCEVAFVLLIYFYYKTFI